MIEGMVNNMGVVNSIEAELRAELIPADTTETRIAYTSDQWKELLPGCQKLLISNTMLRARVTRTTSVD